MREYWVTLGTDDTGGYVRYREYWVTPGDTGSYWEYWVTLGGTRSH